MDGRALYWPRGRVWGGSSTLNAMVYIRGHPLDYDRWESEGAVGWSYKLVYSITFSIFKYFFRDCLPYFKRAQHHELSTGPSDTYRGHGGPLHVMQGECLNPLHQAFLAAGAEHSDIGATEDMNGYRLMDLNIFK